MFTKAETATSAEVVFPLVNFPFARQFQISNHFKSDLEAESRMALAIKELTSDVMTSERL